MPTPYTTPFTAVTGTTISSADHNGGVRNNLLHFRDMLPDPTAANQILTSTGTDAATFGLLGASSIAPGNVGTAALQDLSITAGKIADLAIPAGKIANLAIVPAKLDTIDSPANDEVLTYDSGTARMEWQAVSALTNSIPSQAIVAIPTAAQIPAGWSRFSALDGRLPMGAGVRHSVTWDENTAYGTGWTHVHTGPSHNHVGVSHVHALSNAPNRALPGAGSTTLALEIATGAAGDGGSTGLGGTGDTGAADLHFVLPMFSLVWMQKS